MVLKIDELPRSSKKMGLYAISESAPEGKDSIKFKIGMATNLYRRLNSYNICPGLWTGFYVYGLIVLNEQKAPTAAELRKLKFKTCYTMEQLLFRMIEHKYPKAHLVELKDITGAREVFQMTAENLHAVLKDFVKEQKNTVAESHIYSIKSSGGVEPKVPFVKPKKYEGLSVSEIEKEKKDFERDLKKIDKMEKNKFYKEHPRVAPTRELPKRERKSVLRNGTSALHNELLAAQFFRKLR